MDGRFHWETRLHTLAGPLPPRKRLAAPPLKTTSLPGPPSLLLILSAQQTAHTSHDHLCTADSSHLTWSPFLSQQNQEHKPERCVASRSGHSHSVHGKSPGDFLFRCFWGVRWRTLHRAGAKSLTNRDRWVLHQNSSDIVWFWDSLTMTLKELSASAPRC